jgi:hypothetical protein
MARNLRRKGVRAECAADGARTAAQSASQRGVGCYSTRGDLLEGGVDALLVFCDGLGFGHCWKGKIGG